MNDEEYPSAWEADVALKDGQTVRIRPISPEDGERLRRFHARQSEESIYFRFFTPRPRLSERDIVHFTNVEHHDRVAFVAILADEMIGVARYERYAGTDTAEVAFFVDDDNNGRGLGTVLLEYLAAAARYRNLRRFTASTLPANRSMLAVFAAAGYDVTTKLADGVIDVSFDIGETEESLRASDRRQREAEAASVRYFFAPESIAVIGRGSFRDLALSVGRNISEGGYTGEIHHVEPDAEIPRDIDLVLVSTPNTEVAGVVEECGARGAHAVAVLSAGFGESGPRGAALEAELVKSARRHGIRVLGPNCLALMNSELSVRLYAGDVPEPPSGPISLLAESGSLARPMIDHARRSALGVATFVAAGNRADVGTADLLSYWTDHSDTKAVLLYLRSSELSTSFVRAARTASVEKPVAALGQVLVSDADTDHAARLVDALTRQTGVINVGTMEQLSDIGRLLSSQPIPLGPGVALVGNSDGALAIAADACRGAGLDVVDLSETVLPVANPTYLDVNAEAAQYRSALSAVSRSAGVHNVLVVHSPPSGVLDEEIVKVIVEASEAAPDVTFSATMLGGAGTPTLVAPGSNHEVPVFRFPEHAARAAGRLAEWRDWRASAVGQDLQGPEGSDPVAAREIVEAVLDRSDGLPAKLTLDEQETLLATYGVPIADRKVVASVADAVLGADAIGWPVTLKGSGRDQSTRSTASGVALDLRTPGQVELAWEQIEGRYGERFHPAVVQEFIDGRLDASIVVRQDPFGSGTIEIGLGGAATGVDRPALGLLPLTLGDAQALVGGSSLARVLTDRMDRVPLVGLLHRLAALVDEVEEVDLIRADPIVLSDVGAAIADVEIEVSRASGELDVRRVD